MPATTAPMASAHALIIAAGEYVHAPRLPASVVAGAERLAELLADPDQGGYRPDRVRRLTDSEVTVQRVGEELALLAAEVGEDSTVLVTLSGHGWPRGDDGEVCFLTPAADPSDREQMARTAIPASRLRLWLAKLPSRRVVVLFDCCHASGMAGGSGGDAEPVDSAPGAVPGSTVPEDFCRSLGRDGGRVVVCAAREGELARVRDGAEGGGSVFLAHLLAGLRGGAGAPVRVWDLFEYLQPRVTAEVPGQHPVLFATLEENFVVARPRGLADDRPAPDSSEPPYDAYLSYADRGEDAAWVWDVLVPELEAAGLRLAVAGDAEQPGVARVVSAERGIRRAARTVLVLSPDYLEDEMTGFIDVLAQTLGLEEGAARLLPVLRAPIPAERLPARLRMLVCLDLTHPRRAARNFQRLIRSLHQPVPTARSGAA